MNNKFKFIVILFLVFISTISLAQPWEELARKTVQLYKQRDYENGIYYANLALEKALNEFGKNHKNYASSLSNLALLYKSVGKYSDAEVLYLEALSILTNYYPDENFIYAITIDNLGNLYVTMGRYGEAETCYKKAADILKQYNYGENYDYATCLNNLANLYKESGRYNEAIELYKEAIRIFGITLDRTHPLYAIALDNLATVYTYLGRYKEAEPLMKKALNVFEINYGKNNVDYLITSNNLGVLYLTIKKYDEAERYFKQTIEIYKDLYSEENIDYAVTLNNLGLLYSEQRDYNKAEKYYLESLKIIKKVLNDDNPQYSTTILNLGELYQETGDYSKAEECYSKAAEINLNHIYKYFPALSEKEKLQFLGTTSYEFSIINSFAIKHGDNSIYDKLLNISIATKGIVLNSTTLLRERIKRSNDKGLMDLYQKFLTLRQYISNALNLSSKERISSNINLDSLEKIANELEKELSKKSEVFNTELTLSNASWRKIQDVLKDDEAAIDIINFQFYDNYWTDTVWYCAFIFRNDSKYPEFVKLFTEDDLQKYLEASPASNFSYVRNSTRSKELYTKIFKPLEKYFSGISKLYISLSGSLNRISYPILRTEDDKLLIEKYNLHFYNNLSELLKMKPAEDKNVFNEDFLAVIFGGAKYDLDTTELKAIATRYKTNVNGNFQVERSLSFIVDENIRGSIPKWNYLPGTLEEANLIENIFKSKNYKTEKYIGSEASEDVLKNIISNKPITILHIATHGYFFPELEDKFKDKNILGASAAMTIRTAKNPLLRSGIILSGANLAWAEGKTIKGADDGILTAYDVSNLDLNNTELVVLSACETGLGDITSGEGVFGLQRAFKIAGAKSLIMSLWKVPDKQTVELMNLFYQYWIEGMSKYEAFRKAQLEMNKNYPKDPYLWGAFVLIE
ncbi:MAG: CHAT domain-containing protein [Ignavibacteria bacterium]|nr:CHAT domain-containing protein [Ignavibacteria bacterium]